jgi:serine/threonine protein phosphatase 1
LPLSFLSKKNSKRRPQLPEGVRIYAIGDVHGRADLLEKVFSSIDADQRAYPVQRPIQVMIGDYIDRGPASRETLDMMIARSRTQEMVLLKGNHESYVAEFLQDPSILQSWQQYGGLQTLMSYGLKPPINANSAEQIELSAAFRQALPPTHAELLARMRATFVCGDYFFVHAGVRPGVALKDQIEDDLLWIRDDFLHSETDFGKFIVHGHTPVAEPDIRTNRINIDTGAYATGRLTCILLEKDTCVVL